MVSNIVIFLMDGSHATFVGGIGCRHAWGRFGFLLKGYKNVVKTRKIPNIVYPLMRDPFRSTAIWMFIMAISNPQSPPPQPQMTH